MNERIKELAHEAGLPTYNPGGIPTKLEKFAELIVRECADICKKQSLHYAEHNNPGSASGAADCCRRLIEMHFGVER